APFVTRAPHVDFPFNQRYLALKRAHEENSERKSASATIEPRPDTGRVRPSHGKEDQRATKNTSKMSLRPPISSAALYVPTGKFSTEMGSFDCGTRLRLKTCLSAAASSTISDAAEFIVPALQPILTGSPT